MWSRVFIALLIFFPKFLLGQTCLHKDLSKKLDFKTEIERIKIDEDLFDSCVIRIIITDKLANVIQTIQLTSTGLFEDAFKNCNAARSFSTGINLKEKALDNDYGDVIIADFNFDLKEDVAIKNASGGNGGPDYSYFIQNGNGRFVIDKYLTERVGYFPAYINNKQRTLTTLVHANAMEMCKTIYKINTSRDKWTRIKRTWVSY